MKKILTFLFFIIVLTANSFAASNENSAWNDWRKGYEVFLKAEALLSSGKLQEALKLYKESHYLYAEVKRTRPDWNQNVINNRLDICEKQIAKIQERLGNNASKNSQSSNKKVNIKQFNHKKVTFNNSNTSNLISESEYKKRYFALFIEAENLRKQLRAQSISSDNIQSLLKEKQDLESKLSSLGRKYEVLKSSKQEVDSATFNNLQKLLIAEKLKSENSERRINILNSTIDNLNNDIKINADKYSKLVDEFRAKNQVLNNKINELANLNNVILAKNNTIAELKNTIELNNSNIQNLNNNIVANKQEIDKLNGWIDKLKQDDQKNVIEKVVAENRKLKDENNNIVNQNVEFATTIKNYLNQISTFERLNNASKNTIADLTAKNQSLTIELGNLRNEYLTQLESAKQDKAVIKKMTNENKEQYDNLNSLVAKNEELNQKLVNKTSSEDFIFSELQKYKNNLKDTQAEADKKIKNLQDDIAKLKKNLSSPKTVTITQVDTTKINELEKIIAQLKNEKITVQNENQAGLNKLADAEKTINQLNENIKALELKTVNFNNINISDNAKLTQAYKVIANLEKNISELTNNQKISTDKLEELKKQIINYQKDNSLVKANMKIEILESNLNNLIEKNRILADEISNVKNLSSKNSNAQKFMSNNNKDYKKLENSYNELKEKYEFLSLELESLSKPLAEIGENATSNSENEVDNFLQNAANEAISNNDISSAAWYYEELYKAEPNNSKFLVNYIMFSILSTPQIANDTKNEIIQKITQLDNSDDKLLILGTIDLINNKLDIAKKEFSNINNLIIFKKHKNVILKNIKLLNKSNDDEFNNVINKL